MDAMQTVVVELQKVHGLSERDAASLAITVTSVVSIKLKRKAAPTDSKCPFRNPSFRAMAEDPCPVCGVTSNVSSAEIRATCVDP